MTKSKQQKILDAVAAHIRAVVPNEWEVVAGCSLRLLSENVGNIVVVAPDGIEWKRTAKGRVFAEHRINVVFRRRIDAEAFDECLMMLDTLARWYLLSDADFPFDEFPCMGAETIDGAEAGFDPDELTGTPTTFHGGLRLTFWSD